MITLEQVEKLKERANVSYEDAKAALEITDGDLLEAVIYLERQGKISAPGMGAYNTRTGGQGQRESDRQSQSGPQNAGQGGYYEEQQRRGPTFKQQCRGLWEKFCVLIRKANTNQFEIHREGRCLISMPVTLLIVSILCFFWVTLPALVIALFFGCRYRFRGPDFGKNTINNVMDQAADTAENLKRSVMTEDGREDGQEDNV